MPKMVLTENVDKFTTRNQYSTLDKFELTMTLEGKELPTMAVMGGALEAALEMIQQRVTESYKVVPERVGV